MIDEQEYIENDQFGMQKLYNMKLGETFNYDIGIFIRVPGGWVFYNKQGGRNMNDDMTSCFIPYTEEGKTHD